MRCRLVNVQYLSMEHNMLEELPFELCALRNLTELRVAYNRLNSLPLEFGYLINLQLLHLQKNRLKELPEVNTSLDSGSGQCKGIMTYRTCSNQRRELCCCFLCGFIHIFFVWPL